ncbi:MAG: EamA family transporter, partial [Oscillospiraceae bacterium]|nr:EamA family transporter [Oscillospiraceae bacterium]
LAIIGFGTTGLGFVTHMLAMEKNSAREAALIFFFKPMLAPLFAFIFLHEDITHHIPGIVCFLIGAGFAMIPALLEEKKKAKQ